jgi:hypothetical protein
MDHQVLVLPPGLLFEFIAIFIYFWQLPLKKSSTKNARARLSFLTNKPSTATPIEGLLGYSAGLVVVAVATGQVARFGHAEHPEPSPAQEVSEDAGVSTGVSWDCA